MHAHPRAGLGQPSLTKKKLRRLELTAGAPKGKAGAGIWSTNKAMRQAERELARQARRRPRPNELSHSDLDLLLVIDDESFEVFCEEWQSWVGKLAPTVAAKPRSFARGFLVNATTPSCARFDVFVRGVAGVTSEPGWEKPAAVFDRDGIAQMLPEPRQPPAVERDGGWLSELIYTFLRTLSVLPMLLERGELVRLTQHAQLMKQDLLELLIFENGDPPCRRPGAWAWVDLSERRSRRSSSERCWLSSKES